MGSSFVLIPNSLTCVVVSVQPLTVLTSLLVLLCLHQVLVSLSLCLVMCFGEKIGFWFLLTRVGNSCRALSLKCFFFFSFGSPTCVCTWVLPPTTPQVLSHSAMSTELECNNLTPLNPKTKKVHTSTNTHLMDRIYFYTIQIYLHMNPIKKNKCSMSKQLNLQ